MFFSGFHWFDTYHCLHFSSISIKPFYLTMCFRAAAGALVSRALLQAQGLWIEQSNLHYSFNSKFYFLFYISLFAKTFISVCKNVF